MKFTKQIADYILYTCTEEFTNEEYTISKFSGSKIYVVTVKNINGGADDAETLGYAKTLRDAKDIAKLFLADSANKIMNSRWIERA